MIFNELDNDARFSDSSRIYVCTHRVPRFLHMLVITFRPFSTKVAEDCRRTACRLGAAVAARATRRASV
eukprot:567822-Pleurochrysis_carterae.AAC.2